LIEWAVVTIDALHVPEAWNNVDLLKLKCSTEDCEEQYTVAKL